MQVTRVGVVGVARRLWRAGELDTTTEKEKGGSHASGESGGGTETGAYRKARADGEVDRWAIALLVP